MTGEVAYNGKEVFTAAINSWNTTLDDSTMNRAAGFDAAERVLSERGVEAEYAPFIADAALNAVLAEHPLGRAVLELRGGVESPFVGNLLNNMQDQHDLGL